MSGYSWDDPRLESYGWGDDEPTYDDEVPRPRRRGRDANIDSMVECSTVLPCDDPNLRPHEVRNARLVVAERCTDVEDARYWLAALGLIPDPFEPAPTRQQRDNEVRNARNAERRAARAAATSHPQGDVTHG